MINHKKRLEGKLSGLVLKAGEMTRSELMVLQSKINQDIGTIDRLIASDTTKAKY